MSFETFVKEIKDNNIKVFGIEQYYDGKLIHSFGDTTKGIYPLHSITKSILSLAVGICADKNIINLSDSVADYLSNIQPAYNTVTIERLLTMSIMDYPFNIEDDNYLNNILAIPLNNVDKYCFNYSNITAYLMSVVLTIALKSDLWAFIRENILLPLDITNVEYHLTSDGYFYGASKMKLSVHDVSKIALLLYNQGVYQNKKIVSKNYIQKATSKQIDNKEGGYGYYFWKYKNGFAMKGSYKQRCYILPEEKTIITFLSDIKDESNAIVDLMEKHLLSL